MRDKKCEMRDKKCEMRDKNARCEIKKCEMRDRCHVFLRHVTILYNWSLRQKMEMLVFIGICVVFLLDMTNCVDAVLPSYIPVLSSNTQHESILTARHISARHTYQLEGCWIDV